MSSLFGNLGASQNKPSLFGSQPTSQGSSLFSGLNAPTSNSNLFASTSQPQQNSAPAFGSSLPAFGQTLPASQPQQSSGTSLFGQTAQQTQPQAGATTLGGSTLQQSQNQTQQPLQQQNSQPGGYFDSLLGESRKRAHGETALEELPSLQLGLGDIRQRIKRLGPVSQDRNADGRAHYLLAASGVDPGTAVRDLNYFDNQSSKADRTQSAVSSDTDVEGYIANLQTQSTLGMIADGLARSVRDFDTFLEENVTMEWDAQRKRIYQHFGLKPRAVERGAKESNSFGASNPDDRGGFGRSRRTKGQHMGGSKGPGTPNGSTFGRSGLQRSVIGSAGPMGSTQRPPFLDAETKGQENAGNAMLGPDDRYTREKESKFAEKVQELNAARLQRRPFPILQEFAHVEAQSTDQHVRDVVNGYEALMEMVGEYSEGPEHAEPSNIKERQFAEAYLNEAQNSAKGIALRKRILRGANRHLEKEFFENLEVLVAKNPREANLGGVPNVLSKVKAYVRLRAARKDLVPDNTDLQMLGDDYVWALVFYLLRTGHIKEAVEYVTSNIVAFRAIDRNFITYISDYYNGEDRRLRRDLQERINSEYNQRARIAPEHSIDPFRMACYKVIGRCDITNRSLPGLNQTLEDWVWLQFNLAREVNVVEDFASDAFSLANVQDGIRTLGTRHFPTGGNPDQNSGFGMFFYLQILAGLFENAINFLYQYQYVDATHFSVALDYYGLLRVADLSATELLSHDTRGRPQINFAQMIGWYTRDFRAANVVAAVDYLTLICLNSDLGGDAGRQQVEICHQGLRELVLESREFAKLLGDMRLDGQRIKGAIEERMKLIGLVDTDDFMRTVTISAASIADDSGRTTDAVLLYHLAGEYDKVIHIINIALSEAVALDIGQDKITLMPLRPRVDQLTSEQQQSSSLSLTSVDDPIKLAQTICGIYNAHPMYYEKLTQVNKDTCRVLLRMSEAKDKVAEGRWTEALDIITSIKILPLEARGDSSIVRQFASKYTSLPETITRNVPNLIIWTIRSCSQQRAILASAQYGSNEGTRRQMIDDLKMKAKDLMMYSGHLRYRLPASVNDTLARIAAE